MKRWMHSCRSSKQTTTHAANTPIPRNAAAEPQSSPRTGGSTLTRSAGSTCSRQTNREHTIEAAPLRPDRTRLPIHEISPGALT